MSIHNHSSHDMRLSHDSVGDYLDKIGAIDLLNAEDEVELAKQIEAGLYASHLLEEDVNESLDASYRKDLGRIAIEGIAARQRMIEANTRLAVSAASHFKRNGYEFDDIIQDANSGLIRAVQGFDYAKGFKFSTYAMWWINQSIFKGIQDNGRAIRIPANWHTMFSKINRIKNEYLTINGTEPSYEHIATAYGNNITAEEIQRIEQIFETTETYSINRPIDTDSDELTLLDSISTQVDETQPSVEDHFDDNDLSKKMIAIIDTTLRPRDAQIIRMRYGFYHGEPMTLEAIGDCYDLSRERVRQIIKSASAKLQAHPEMDSLAIYCED